MYIQHLKNIMKSTLLSRADIAGAAGVSRAAVTRWFAKGKGADWINIETNTLRQLAMRLKVPTEYFIKPLSNLDLNHTQFLWDGLYPDMESFGVALVQKRPQALARLVQVLGFREASFIVGRRATDQFDTYKRFIKPNRRKELETVWPLYLAQ